VNLRRIVAKFLNFVKLLKRSFLRQQANGQQPIANSQKLTRQKPHKIILL